jgi:trehalose 6-phosphate synthase/phosphatase
MDRWFGDLPIGLVCEHGLTVKHPGERWSEPPNLDAETLTGMVAPMFRDFCERTPGSKVEYKAASIAWHYRAADPKLGAWRAKELRSLLENRLAGEPYSVLSGSRVVEVRHVQMSKGNVVLRLLDRHTDADLVVAAGDDRTDEEMFEALLRSGHERVLMVHVGAGHSAATFSVPSPADLVAQLELMVKTWRAERLAR